MTHRAGWTLLEIVVVLLVMVIGALVAVPAFRGLGPGEDPLVRATLRFEMLFALARDSAIAAGKPVTVLIDSVSGQVWLDARESHGAADWDVGAPTGTESLGQPGLLGPLGAAGAGRVRPSRFQRPAGSVGEGTSLELPAEVELLLPRARARFSFLPSGAFHGDSVIVRSGSASRVITLNAWTGDVAVR